MKKLYISLLSLFFINLSHAQYIDPVKFPLSLSANFGELRNNHFHSGIDIKTQGVINKPVYSVAYGYISRIFVSPSGYGKALYITHPSTGHVSVYGHLERFNDKIEAYLKAEQNKQESYRINLDLDANTFPLKAGEFIAYSGNTGSSGGPHIHFELRDAATEKVIDPLPYYKDRIKDIIPPEVRGIAIYPVAGEGVVNASGKPLRQNISKNKKGELITPKTPFTAWGRIGLGIKAYDRMSGTANIYGVQTVKLYVDNKQVFKSTVDAYSFDQTRMLNTFVDFADWRNNKSFFMKSFIEPGNTLPFFETIDNGYINIDQEKVYNIKYELSDVYGNTSEYRFSISGKKQAIPAHPKGSLYMTWDNENHYLSDAFNLIIPKGNLYDNTMFTLKQTSSGNYFSDIFTVNDEPLPFHKQAEMSIKINNDTLTNKNQYGIVAINGTKESWVGGKYNKGYITVSINEIGKNFAVSSDTQAPVITPIQEDNWEKQQKITLKVVDAKSGVLSCKGMIDGQFALFENDVKSPTYTYHFDPSRLKKGQNHTLEFTATDACGNTSVYTTEFRY